MMRFKANHSQMSLEWSSDNYDTVGHFFDDMTDIGATIYMEVGEKWYSMDQIKTLVFMAENGLGPEDMRNDITYPPR